MPAPETLQQSKGLTAVAFRRLLTWLDDGKESNGETYLEIRRRLVAYFDRRNRLAPDDLADETLNRVATTLAQSGAIAVTPPARYCYVVARFVFLEDLRKREHSHVSLDAGRPGRAAMPDVIGPGARGPAVKAPEVVEETSARERRLECLDRCLDTLTPAQRELIIEYYRATGREKIEARRDLARRLDITMNALAIRASRIRDVLERCVEGCGKA